MTRDSRETQTDGQGRFRLARACPSGTGFVLVIQPGGTGTRRAVAPVPRGGSREIAVALVPGETARGRVLDDAGEPVEDVAVVLVLPYPEPGSGLVISLAERAAQDRRPGPVHARGPAEVRRSLRIPPRRRPDVLPARSLKLGGVDERGPDAVRRDDPRPGGQRGGQAGAELPHPGQPAPRAGKRARSRRLSSRATAGSASPSPRMTAAS